MTELVKTTTNYSVNYTEGAISANGNLVARVDNSIDSMYITILKNDMQIGTSNYYENNGSVNVSYNYKNVDDKDIILSTVDAIVSDIKSQLSK